MTLCGLAIALTIWAQPAATHYNDIDGKSGEALLAALKTCASRGYKSVGYKALETVVYPYTDAHADGSVWDMYSDCTFAFGGSHSANGSECAGWNKEHSIPQSWWGGGTSNEGCDAFHVIPTDAWVNNMRSNYPYGEVGTAKKTSQKGCKLGSSSMSSYTGTVFEPAEEYKGDIARGILGAMVKWQKDWTDSNGSSTFNNTYTTAGRYGLTQYGVDLLIKWCRQDPVSQKELDRNNGLEKTQGNRNPFIDYPELIEYLWGTKTGERVDLSKMTLSYEGIASEAMLTAPLVTTTFNLGNVLVNTTATESFLLKGILLTSDISMSLSGDDADLFSLSPTTVTAADANLGRNIAIIYTPTEEGVHRATLTISSEDFENMELPIVAQAYKQGTEPEPISGDGDYVKVMNDTTDWTGIYLIVSEDKLVCFDGSEPANYASRNKMDVEISEDKVIHATEAIDAASVVITSSAEGYYIKTQAGYYIGHTGGKNTLDTSTTPDFVNSISCLNGDISISTDGRTLRYNSSAEMFRYYTSGQQEIQLYRKTKKAEEGTGTAVTEVEIEMTNAQIYNSVGQYMGRQQEVDIRMLPTGLYILREGKNTKKILIQ